MLHLIKNISKLHYDGDRRKGPRYAYILRELEKRGCEPKVDRYGNIWVERGTGTRAILLSSHIDVDPRVKDLALRTQKGERGTELEGVMDNSAGCAINILLAARKPRRGKVIHVFTASEELARRGENFARSAKEILRQLRKARLKPELCVAIDVTYPGIIGNRKRIDWKAKYEKVFHVRDSAHSYLDGYSNEKSRKLGVYFIRRFDDPHVGMRRFYGHDEAHIFRQIAPSFAFGPIVYGRFDRPGQRMPLVHAKTAFKFLKNVIDSYYNIF